MHREPLNDKGNCHSDQGSGTQGHCGSIGAVKGSKGNCSAKEFDAVLTAVADAISLIDKDILWPIYSQYPELDDLK
jgi:hypothetical protein